MYANGKVFVPAPDQLLFDTNIRLAYHLLTRLYQKHTKKQLIKDLQRLNTILGLCMSMAKAY
jgi:hypothetical protein